MAPPFTASSAGKPVARAILKIRLHIKSLGIEWTEENLEKYLQAPKKSHGFNRVEKNKDRKILIASIKIVTE